MGESSKSSCKYIGDKVVHCAEPIPDNDWVGETWGLYFSDYEEELLGLIEHDTDKYIKKHPEDKINPRIFEVKVLTCEREEKAPEIVKAPTPPIAKPPPPKVKEKSPEIVKAPTPEPLKLATPPPPPPPEIPQWLVDNALHPALPLATVSEVPVQVKEPDNNKWGWMKENTGLTKKTKYRLSMYW